MENIIIYTIVILIFILFIMFQIKKHGLRTYIIEMIVYAEKTYKDNEVKFQSVVNALINKLPFPMNLIPVSIVESIVQKVFDEIKMALDYKKEEK